MIVNDSLVVVLSYSSNSKAWKGLFSQSNRDDISVAHGFNFRFKTNR